MVKFGFSSVERSSLKIFSFTATFQFVGIDSGFSFWVCIQYLNVWSTIKKVIIYKLIIRMKDLVSRVIDKLSYRIS